MSITERAQKVLVEIDNDNLPENTLVVVDSKASDTVKGHVVCAVSPPPATEEDKANADFIAASRTQTPKLLAMMRTAIEGLLEMQAANRDNFGGNRDAGIAQVFRARLTTLCDQWQTRKEQQ